MRPRISDLGGPGGYGFVAFQPLPAFHDKEGLFQEALRLICSVSAAHETRPKADYRARAMEALLLRAVFAGQLPVPRGLPIGRRLCRDLGTYPKKGQAPRWQQRQSREILAGLLREGVARVELPKQDTDIRCPGVYYLGVLAKAVLNFPQAGADPRSSIACSTSHVVWASTV